MTAYQKFKKSKLTDFVYRFLFWFFIAYFLHVLASNSDGNGGAYIAKAISNLPSSNYAHTLGVFGILVGIMAMVLREPELVGNKNKWSNVLQKEGASFLAKISSDLLFVTYGIDSFMIGVVCYHYFHDEFQNNDALVVILVSPMLLIHMLFIATISIFIRSSRDEWLIIKWVAIPPLKRWVIYIGLGISYLLLFWYRK